MSKKSVILTPNRRLARLLRNQSYLTISKKNLTTWRNKEILPLATWLTNFWQECRDPRILLNSHQERLLWQQIINESLGKEFNNIVDTVMKAHELVVNWQLDEETWTNFETEDIAVFRQLHKKFKEYCKKKNYVVMCDLPLLLLPYLQHIDLEITFTDFDEYPPILQIFIDNLQKFNCKVIHNNSNNYEGSLYKKLKFTKQEEEITTIARWAKQIINHNPKSRIGVIASNLTELRPGIIRIFSEVFGNTESINVSAGVIFNSLPIINDALEFLAWKKTFDLKTISKILLSPYIYGAETEKSDRALLDFQLRKLGQAEFRLTDIKFLADKHSRKIPLLINVLQKQEDIFTQIRNKRLDSSDWTKTFAQILQTLGWPGESNLTQPESTAVKRFIELLQELAATNLLVGKIPYMEALGILCNMAKHTIFQSEQETDIPINILGVLEAGGINFDYLWVMGLDQENWPPPANPNPFIPIKIQKKFNLPHSSSERELHFCETLINRLKRSAREIIFSYVSELDGQVVEPSVLIEDILQISADDLNLTTFVPRSKEIYCSKKMEILNDDTSLALTPDESIHGGSRLIESQSLCPFRAFAEFRLKAESFKQLEPGISKIMRGVLIHSALEKFWLEVKTHENLCALSNESLQDLIAKHVKYVLDGENLSKCLYFLEQKCLIRLLTSWLEIEKNRPSFQVVATEKNIQTALGPMQIKLRIDRIDKLTNGNLLLIDYKSGKNLPTIFDWFGERPENPQLPLYCVAVNEAKSFAFAQINAESIKFKEMGLDEFAFGLKTTEDDKFKNAINWHELIVYWREILTNLAKDFVSGEANPEPLSPKVCKQCEFGLICRYTPK